MDKWLKRINCPSRGTSTAITSQPTVEGALSSDNNPRYSSPSRSTFDRDASDAPVASQSASIATDSDEESDVEPPDAGKHAAKDSETTSSKSVKRDKTAHLSELAASLSISEQESLIEISTNGSLKMEFNQKPLPDLWIALRTEQPALAKHAVKTLMPFATTYLCEWILSSDKHENKIQSKTLCGERFKT
ncbi:unnamed protein product [Scomber scombrus]|uniref:Unnamed protein product n=1 Tax=Scomber scombrus TaxID=13677 RepID=A0AAV1PYW4_SCOSC